MAKMRVFSLTQYKIIDSDHTDHQKGFLQRHFCELVGIDNKALTTAYEDILYHLWQEASLPVEIYSKQPELLHAMSRKGLLEKMERGTEKPAGYVAPSAME
ncbi:transglutaminase family protein [Paucibacter sp. O1-1]|nr:transglutaminase family protein [Paucibacter sp. O1-1]MDA3827895.1 transglutaminase family protein [Paucibacter sp. O1-1]